MIKQLYQLYRQDIYYYLYSLTHDACLSEDLTSETFLAALKAIARFEGRSDVKTWLFSIARHKWQEHLRKGRPTVSLSELSEHYLSDNSSLSTQATHNELAERVAVFLTQLDEPARTVLSMRIDGYSYHEIAERCSISEGSARVIDFRAKAKLKQTLAKEGLYEY